MATHKVPQDVEAEDKLLGPWTLRQFIFILMFFGSGWVAFLLSQIALPFGALMLPFLIIFGVLGFVQRKDQPVEVYLTAFVRFNLKPHRRKWDQEGYYQHVIVTAPKKVEVKRFRDITQTEVVSRLNNLAKMMDSRGWAAKGLVTTTSDRLVEITRPQSALEAEVANDILDEQQHVAQNFEALIQQQANDTRLAAIERMHDAQASSATPSVAAEPSTAAEPGNYDPYPSMHQSVISPVDDLAFYDAETTTPQPTEPAVPEQVSPDIIRLANNNDRTVSSIAREAHELPTEEVVVSLR